MGSIENGASLRLIHNLSYSLTCFDRAESLHDNLHFSFLHQFDEKKSTQTENNVGHKTSCLGHHTLVR